MLACNRRRHRVGLAPPRHSCDTDHGSCHLVQRNRAADYTLSSHPAWNPGRTVDCKSYRTPGTALLLPARHLHKTVSRCSKAL